jgi:hypothetical protein
MLSPELLSREILSWKWLRAAEETLEREMGQGKMQLKRSMRIDINGVILIKIRKRRHKKNIYWINYMLCLKIFVKNSGNLLKTIA